VAIVQVSRITNRKGLTENLPQLAGAELGWCVDSRRLFIGNGTLQEGAPVIGNTEILTEFSNITALSNYTYEDIAVGYAAQTGPNPSDPVVRTVQAKLDDFASVRDFGATGDGITDDTAAINRALYQLYCRETNSQIRRSLYFPAGTYRITGTIVIPTWAKLVGEGADCTIMLFQLAPSWQYLELPDLSLVGAIPYTAGAIVTDSGSYYEAITNVPEGIEITNTSFWQEIISTWTSTQTWAKGSIVVNSGIYYEAQQPVPAGISISNSTYWSVTSFYSARFGDSLQQIGVNIGTNGATPPRNIEISSMTFQNNAETDVFLVEDATQCWFSSVNFVGPLTDQDIIVGLAVDDIAGVRFSGSSNQLTFDKCRFSGLTYGINTNAEIQDVTVSNSKFSVLYQGLVLGTGTLEGVGPTGVRAVFNMFDDVYAEGVIYGAVSLNATAHNVFYDVGNNFTNSPATPIVRFDDDNNVSFSDMFERDNTDAVTQPRVAVIGGSNSTATVMQLGRYARRSGLSTALPANATTTFLQVNRDDVKAFRVDYTMVDGEFIRTGTMTITAKGGSGADTGLAYSDDYTENSTSPATSPVARSVMSAAMATVGADTVVSVRCATPGGSAITLSYSVEHLA
jgi:hypothetical protein